MSPTSSSQQQHTGLGKVNRSPPTHQLLSVNQYILIPFTRAVDLGGGERGKMALTLSEATTMMNAALAKATELDIYMNCSVVDAVRARPSPFPLLHFPRGDCQ